MFASALISRRKFVDIILAVIHIAVFVAVNIVVRFAVFVAVNVAVRVSANDLCECSCTCFCEYCFPYRYDRL